MVWATVQAEQSRQRLEESREPEEREREQEEVGVDETAEQQEMRRSRLSSNNPFAGVVNNGRGATGAERKTEEETILEKILLAHSEVSARHLKCALESVDGGFVSRDQIQDSLSLLSSRVEQGRRERQHEQDLRTATELSKTYVKGGDDVAENYGEGGSKQRWDSVEDRERAEHEAMLREQEELDRYEREKGANRGHNVTDAAETPSGGGYSHDESIYSTTFNNDAPNTSSPFDGLGALESLRGLDFSTPSTAPTQAQEENRSEAPARASFPASNPYSRLSLATDNLNGSGDPFVESPVSSSFIPNQPSEKALGKLRRISTTGRTEDDSEERQRILEQELREKYKRNLEEQGRKTTDDGGIRQV